MSKHWDSFVSHCKLRNYKEIRMRREIRKWGTFQITKEITKGENMRRVRRNNKTKKRNV
jgi:hypothetical protein